MLSMITKVFEQSTRSSDGEVLIGEVGQFRVGLTRRALLDIVQTVHLIEHAERTTHTRSTHASHIDDMLRMQRNTYAFDVRCVDVLLSRQCDELALKLESQQMHDRLPHCIHKQQRNTHQHTNIDIHIIILSLTHLDGYHNLRFIQNTVCHLYVEHKCA